jgi:ABC-type transporter Mla MlaB component
LGVRYDFSADSDGTVTISLAGELDIRAVPALEAALAPTMAERPARVVIEASALEFADSSAIALFVRWASARHLEIRDSPPFLRGHILRMGLTHRIALGPAPGTPTPEPT